MTTTPSEPGWRPLTAAEATALRENWLGGPLAVMCWAAVVIIALPFVAVVQLVVSAGPDALKPGLGAILSIGGTGLAGTVLRLSMGPLAAIWIWAIVFVAMTAGRAPAAPRVASVLFVLVVVLKAATQISIRVVVARGAGIGFGEAFQMLPYLCMDLVVAAALWGYLHDGRRPNVYYRRRVRAG